MHVIWHMCRLTTLRSSTTIYVYTFRPLSLSYFCYQLLHHSHLFWKMLNWLLFFSIFFCKKSYFSFFISSFSFIYLKAKDNNLLMIIFSVSDYFPHLLFPLPINEINVLKVQGLWFGWPYFLARHDVDDNKWTVNNNKGLNGDYG